MAERWIVQFCHCHYGPFADVARQYAALFDGSPYKVLTVYLTGKPSDEVAAKSASDEVIFLNFDGKAVAGLKLGAIRAFRKIVASRDVAMIIAHRAKPIYIACLATKLPVIGVHHAFDDYKRASRRWFANYFRQRLSLLAVSNAVRDNIRGHLKNWPPEKIQTLYNRIDVSAARANLLTREEARRMLGLPDDVPVIANVGRLHADKDQATLLAGFAKALPKLPADTLLVIAGSGPLETTLKAQATTLDIAGNVRFLGQVKDVARLFRAFDLFVLSSDHEPFGMVLLEAMVAGVPVIATDCGGGREVVEEIGHLFPLGDSVALAHQLVQAISTEPASRAEQQEKMRTRLIESFSDEAVRSVFWRILESFKQHAKSA